MPVLNRGALRAGRSTQPHASSPSRSMRKPVPKVSVHGLPAVRVPAGTVQLPYYRAQVADFYLTDPVRVRGVQEWAARDGKMPLVRFAMETEKSPHRPGELHVAEIGAHPDQMQEVEMICDYELDAAQGHLELVGEPYDVLTRYLRLGGNSDRVMTGLSVLEQSALAAHVNRVSVQERAQARLGALTLVSEAQIVHAAGHPDLFEDAPRLPGMPRYVAHWTRDLGDPNQLTTLSPKERIWAWRIWRGGDHRDGRPLPVAAHDGGNPGGRGVSRVARFAVLPDSTNRKVSAQSALSVG